MIQDSFAVCLSWQLLLGPEDLNHHSKAGRTEIKSLTEHPGFRAPSPLPQSTHGGPSLGTVIPAPYQLLQPQFPCSGWTTLGSHGTETADAPHPPKPAPTVEAMSGGSLLLELCHPWVPYQKSHYS